MAAARYRILSHLGVGIDHTATRVHDRAIRLRVLERLLFQHGETSRRGVVSRQTRGEVRPSSFLTTLVDISLLLVEHDIHLGWAGKTIAAPVIQRRLGFCLRK